MKNWISFLSLMVLVVGIGGQKDVIEVKLTETNPTVILSSPEYPNFYTRPSYQVWRVEVPWSRTVSFQIVSMDLPSYTPCSTLDYLLLYDSQAILKDNKLAEFCGTSIGSGQSHGRYLTVEFNANPGPQSYKGYQLKVSIGPESDSGGQSSLVPILSGIFGFVLSLGVLVLIIVICAYVFKRHDEQNGQIIAPIKQYQGTHNTAADKPPPYEQ